MPVQKNAPKAASRKAATPAKPQSVIPSSDAPKIAPSKAPAQPQGPLGLAPLSHHHWSRWTYLVLAAVAAVTLAFGTFAFVRFGGSDDAPSETTPTPQAAAPEVPFDPDLAGGNRNAHGHNYPVAVMIDNHSAARPQSGIQAASVVYEALVEGGITRLMAVYDQGEITQIGPVRSARPYFLQWLAEYDAAYAHAGGSPEALAGIRQDRVHDINAIGNAAKAFSRDRSRPAPHNLYTTSFAMFLATEANELKYSDADITPWTFGTTLVAGTPAKTVTMNFSGSAKGSEVRYAYDSGRKQWLRSQAGQAHNDRLTSKHVGVTNLVIQRISNNIPVGEKGRLTMTVTGTGKAKVYQQGQVVDATWSKPDRESRTTFTLADGTPVTFLPGNTWIEVLPEGRTLTTE